jgi:hypothetical protein
VHAAPGRHLHCHLDVLALPKGVEGGSNCAEFGTERREEHQVVEDSVHFAQGDAQVLRAFGNLDLHELLERNG